MLTSLFGELGPPAGRKDAGDAADPGFAATAILQTVATEVNDRGQMVDRHSHDLVVSGSPAQAIREHFTDTRSDLDTATSLITLLDPAGVWAAAVIKALSDASGRPIERLHLREHATLRTLATIERTTLVRRDEDTLRIYRADVRAPGSENAEIPIALMERSQMTTVIIGPLQPHAIDALLAALHAAAMLPTWRCPNLLFMLPPNAVWIGNKIGAIAWPGRLHVHLLSESMSGASAVWNAMLGMWNQVKAQPGWDPVETGPSSETARPIDLAGPIGEAARVVVAPGPLPLRAGLLDPARARAALAGMLALDGLIGCAVVDAASGEVLAQTEVALSEPPVELDRAAAACAQLLNAHRHAAASLGMREPLDELAAGSGARQLVIRMLARRPELILVALFDKPLTNLALARYQMTETERGLF